MAEYVILMFFIWAHFARIRYHNDCNNWENTSFEAIKIWSWLWIRFWNDTVVYIQIRFKILVWLRISTRIVNGLSVLSSSAQFPKIHYFVFKQETYLISFCVENENSNKQLLVSTYIHWNISKCIRFRLCAQLSPTVDGVLCLHNVSHCMSIIFAGITKKNSKAHVNKCCVTLLMYRTGITEVHVHNTFMFYFT